MKSAWIAPFVLALAASPVLAVDTSSNVQQQSHTQENVSPNAINPGQGKQPDGYSDGGKNQQHTDDFGDPGVADSEGDTDIGVDPDTDDGTNTDNADNADSDTSSDGSARGASADSGSSVDNSASADTGADSDTDD